MSKFIVNKTSNYTVMSNLHLREKEMSLKAKGLLSLMLSLPDDWDYSIVGLCTLSKDGKDSVMATLNELEQFGYLVRTKLTDERGRFAGYDYCIYEEPQTENPCAENPNTEKPNTENPQQLNNNIPRTKQQNTNIIKDIVEFLNEQCGSGYKHTSAKTQKLIRARLAEGFTLDDFKAVIAKKVAEWKGTEMEQYLRPETLFGTKFEGYLNAPTQRKRASATRVSATKSLDQEIADWVAEEWGDL